MPEVKPTMALIARWTRNENPYLDRPRTITWEDGSPATIDDYVKHMCDTHTYVSDHTSGALELRMFPEIVADVKWDTTAGVWAVSGAGVKPAALCYLGLDAPDEQIIAQLFTFPVVYRARIYRDSDKTPPVRDVCRVVRIN